MQNTTEQSKRLKKIAPILCAGAVIAFLGVYLATLLYPLLTDAFSDSVVTVVLVFYGLLIVAVIAGVLAALAQRLKEIDGGEEEDAKQY